MCVCVCLCFYTGKGQGVYQPSKNVVVIVNIIVAIYNNNKFHFCRVLFSGIYITVYSDCLNGFHSTNFTKFNYSCHTNFKKLLCDHCMKCIKNYYIVVIAFTAVVVRKQDALL